MHYIKKCSSCGKIIDQCRCPAVGTEKTVQWDICDECKPSINAFEPQKSFEENLQELINRHSKENGSNTPDFILADFMCRCLKAFNYTTKNRDAWYNVTLRPGNSHFHLRPEGNLIDKPPQEIGEYFVEDKNEVEPLHKIPGGSRMKASMGKAVMLILRDYMKGPDAHENGLEFRNTMIKRVEEFINSIE